MDNAQGADLSKWDVAPIEYGQYRSRNSFAFIKVSEGVWKDPLFDAQWAAAKGETVRSPYHFWRSYVNQKDAVHTMLSFLGNDAGELQAALDLETADGSDQVMSLTHVWVDEYHAQTGLWPIIYSRRGFLHEHGADFRTMWDRLYGRWHNAWLANCPLWLAEWPFDELDSLSGYALHGDALRAALIREVIEGKRTLSWPSPIGPWTQVDYWQWTSRYPPEQVPGYFIGANHKLAVDMNFARASREEFEASHPIPGAEPPPVPEPEPQPQPQAKPYEVITDARVRATPGGEVVGGVMERSTVWGVTQGDWLNLAGYVHMSLLAEPGAAPVPEPEPLPEGEFYRVRHDQEMASYAFRPRQFQPDWNGNLDGIPETVRIQVEGTEAVLMDRRTQEFMFEALKREAPSDMSEADLEHVFTWLYGAHEAFNNNVGFASKAKDERRANFITGDDEDAPLPKLLPPVVTGGKIVRRIGTETRMIAGELHIQVETLKAGSLPDLAVDNIRTMPWHWIPATTVTVISVATNERDREGKQGPWRCNPFPQLKGGTVPVPHITNAGYCWVAVSRLVRVDNPFRASPYVPER